MASAAPKIPLWIDGAEVQSQTDTWLPIEDPKDPSNVIALVPQATPAELRASTESARAAFEEWGQTPITQRQRVMFKLQHLIQDHTEELAAAIVAENGKRWPMLAATFVVSRSWSKPAPPRATCWGYPQQLGGRRRWSDTVTMKQPSALPGSARSTFPP